jgi:predicted transcriptional regulator
MKRQGVRFMGHEPINSSMLDFIKNNVLSITDLTRTNKLSEILESYANKKSEDIYNVKKNRNRDAQCAIVDVELLTELLAMREAVFAEADTMIERIATDRVENVQPQTSLSNALHQMDVKEIDVDEVLKLSRNLELDE